MEHAAVLDIGAFTYIDCVDVGPSYCVKPDTGIGFHYHSAY
jgi:hypothetical protein